MPLGVRRALWGLPGLSAVCFCVVFFLTEELLGFQEVGEGWMGLWHRQHLMRVFDVLTLGKSSSHSLSRDFWCSVLYKMLVELFSSWCGVNGNPQWCYDMAVIVWSLYRNIILFGPGCVH